MINSGQINSEKEYLGIKGIFLIACVLELFIAVYHPIIKSELKGITELSFVTFLLFLTAINRLVVRRENCFQTYDYIIIAYIIYCFYSFMLSSILGNYPLIPGIMGLKRYIFPFIIYFLLKYSIDNLKQAQALINTLNSVFILLAAFSLISFVLWPQHFSKWGRLKGYFDQPNLYGLFVVMMSPMFLLVFKAQRKFIKQVKYISVIIIFISLILTGSRGAFVGQIVIFGLLYLRTNYKFKTIIGTIIAIAIISSVFFYSNLDIGVVSDRILPSEKENMNKYSAGRLGAWQAIFKEAQKKMFFGYGLNSFVMESHWSTHNEYLNIIYTLGLIGLFNFLLIQYNLLKYLKYNDNVLVATACRYGILGYLTVIIFGQPTTIRYPFWILIAVCQRFIDLSKTDKK